MTSRDRTVLIVIALIGVIAGSWMLLVSPKRADVAAAQGELSQAQASVAAAEQQLAAGRTAAEELDEQTVRIARVGKAVPADDDLASLIVQVQSIATRTRVSFDGLERSATTSTAAPATPAASLGTTTATTSAPPAAAGTAAAAAGASPALPPGVTSGAEGLGMISLKLSFSGRFLRLEDALRRLRELTTVRDGQVVTRGRLLTIDGVTLALVDAAEGADTGGQAATDRLQATVQLTAYVQPADLVAMPAATPGVAPELASTVTAAGSSSTESPR